MNETIKILFVLSPVILGIGAMTITSLFYRKYLVTKTTQELSGKDLNLPKINPVDMFITVMICATFWGITCCIIFAVDGSSKRKHEYSLREDVMKEKIRLDAEGISRDRMRGLLQLLDNEKSTVTER